MDPKYPGIYFLWSPWEANVTSKGLDISWEDIGIAIHIPRGAVLEDKCLIVRPTLTGPYEPPEGFVLASPVYSISRIEFEKDVTLTLYHFVDLQSDEDCECMSFISAPSAPVQKGYQFSYAFEELTGGIFQKQHYSGSVDLRHFCLTGAATRKRRHSPESTSSESSKRLKGNRVQDIHFSQFIKSFLYFTGSSESQYRYSVRLYTNSRPSEPCSYAVWCVTLYHNLLFKVSYRSLYLMFVMYFLSVYA